MAFPQDIGVKLVCPKCRTEVVRDGESFVCASAACRLRYAIIDDIPKFLVEDAEHLAAEDWGRIMERRGRAASGAAIRE
jgi:uncharacterized protein YbaR (Trm112 family)